jgi:hypothetical protein
MLAARNGGEGQLVQLIFFAILAVIFIIGKLINKGTEKSRVPEGDETEEAGEDGRVPVGGGAEAAGRGDNIRPQLKKDMDAAWLRYEQKLGQIRAAEKRLTRIGGSPEMHREWNAKLEAAKRAAEQEYEQAKKKAQMRYEARMGGSDRPAPRSPVKREQKVPAAGAVKAAADEVHGELQATAAETHAAEIKAGEIKAGAPETGEAPWRAVLRHDDLAKAVLYSEILGKPLALRD